MADSELESQSELPSVLKKLVKWGDYAAMGNPVPPTRFVPCKTPLSRQILNSWSLKDPPLHPLTVPQLIQEQAAQRRKIGLVLDLSNHDCLYSDDIPSTVRYIHIQLVAKELPPQSFVNSVCEAAKAFWTECPELYIAVHCAYGFNRTGFILCSYLIQELGLSVDAALSAFKTARPPGVKHDSFRQELRRRYEPSPSPCIHSALSLSSSARWNRRAPHTSSLVASNSNSSQPIRADSGSVESLGAAPNLVCQPQQLFGCSPCTAGSKAGTQIMGAEDRACSASACPSCACSDADGHGLNADGLAEMSGHARHAWHTSASAAAIAASDDRQDSLDLNGQQVEGLQALSSPEASTSMLDSSLRLLGCCNAAKGSRSPSYAVGCSNPGESNCSCSCSCNSHQVGCSNPTEGNCSCSCNSCRLGAEEAGGNQPCCSSCGTGQHPCESIGRAPSGGSPRPRSRLTIGLRELSLTTAASERGTDQNDGTRVEPVLSAQPKPQPRQGALGSSAGRSMFQPFADVGSPPGFQSDDHAFQHEPDTSPIVSSECAASENESLGFSERALMETLRSCASLAPAGSLPKAHGVFSRCTSTGDIESAARGLE